MMRRAILILLAINLGRFAFSLGFDLTPQEAYYFFYSQHPALSYFDHPPAIAIFLWLFSAMLGPTELAIRLTAFTLTAGTQIAFLMLAGKFLPREKLARAAVLFSTTAMVSVLSLISTPDVPLLFFWTLSLLFLYRAVFEQSRVAWLLAGLAMGLAFDSKYTASFLQLGLLVFLIGSRAHRHFLRTPWPYLSIAMAHLAMAPVYVWNWQHGFASFLFQSSGRASHFGGLTFRYFLKLLATQSFLLFPPLLFAVVWFAARSGIHRSARGWIRHPEAFFLISFFAPMFLLFTGLSFFALVKPNWLMPTYVTGLIFAAAFISKRLTRWQYGLSALVHAVMAAELLFYPVPIRSDDTWFGWKELSRRVAALQKLSPESFVFSADDYKTTAELAFYTGSKIFGANVLGQRALQFDFVGDDLAALRGRDAIFLDSAPNDLSEAPAGRIPEALAGRFASVEQLEPVVLRSGKSIARKFFVYRCRGYKGPVIQP
jgi:4-amino-4-deoxy-L-arabinose transferase-like glycosyltransferase